MSHIEKEQQEKDKAYDRKRKAAIFLFMSECSKKTFSLQDLSKQK